MVNKRLLLPKKWNANDKTLKVNNKLLLVTIELSRPWYRTITFIITFASLSASIEIFIAF